MARRLLPDTRDAIVLGERMEACVADPNVSTEAALRFITDAPPVTVDVFGAFMDRALSQL